MNLNDLAKEICKREGKKVQVNIAQVKEILKITLKLLNDPKFLMLQDLEIYLSNLSEYYGKVFDVRDAIPYNAKPLITKKKPKTKVKKK